jgi:hypothetical protein
VTEVFGHVAGYGYENRQAGNRAAPGVLVFFKKGFPR